MKHLKRLGLGGLIALGSLVTLAIGAGALALVIHSSFIFGPVIFLSFAYAIGLLLD